MRVLLINFILIAHRRPTDFLFCLRSCKVNIFTPDNNFNDQWLFNSIEQYYSYFS